MTNKAYSILTVNKQYTDEETNERVITGTATTPAADRVNDVINPLGITFQNPLPLLFHHDHEKPVGTVYFENPTEEGIKFVARIADIQEPGKLKDRCDEAWQSVKAQLVRGVSIGFRPTGDVEYIKNGGILYKTCEVFELSLVTIPCNAQATIELIKSLDTSASAIDKDDVEKQESNSEIKSKESETARQLDSENTKYIKVSYKNDSKIIKNNNKGMTTMKFAEQIKNVKSARADKVKAMQDIMSEQVTLDDEQNAQYETLESEVKSLDAQLKRLEDLEKMSASEATDVDVSKAYKPQVVIKTQKDAAPGVAFARIAGALAQAKGNTQVAAEMTKRFTDTPAVHEVLKNKSIGMTNDEAWASPLVENSAIVDEFLELLRPATVLGKIDGFRKVPFNTTMSIQNEGTNAIWVGEAQEIGKTKMGFETMLLSHAKVAAIVPISFELARFSTPSAELAVRDDLVKAISQKIDSTMFDFDAVESNESPGSVLSIDGLVVNSGTNAENVEADLELLLEKFIENNVEFDGCYFVMSTQRAMRLGNMKNALGAPVFEGMKSAKNRELMGYPVVTSTVASLQDKIVLMKPSDILVADDNIVDLDVDPAGVYTNENGVAVSAFERDLVLIRAKRTIRWKRARPSATAFITYDPTFVQS